MIGWRKCKTYLSKGKKQHRSTGDEYKHGAPNIGKSFIIGVYVFVFQSLKDLYAKNGDSVHCIAYTTTTLAAGGRIQTKGQSG